jgi:hypothetical protein
MGIDKLCEMVNSKKAMAYDYGEILTQYMEVVKGEQSAYDYAAKRGVVSDVLSDGLLSYEEVTTCSQLAMTKDHWIEMGGDAKGEGAITKKAFIQAMKRFCSNVQICKDALDAHFELRDKTSEGNAGGTFILNRMVNSADYFRNCRTAKNPNKVAACIQKKNAAEKTDIDECFKK